MLLVQMVESEETQQLVRSAQNAALKAFDVIGKYAKEMIESERTQANLRRIQAELDRAGTTGLDLLSKQVTAAMDNAAIPQTPKDIQIKYKAAAATQAAEMEVEKAVKLAEEAMGSKEAEAARAAG